MRGQLFMKGALAGGVGATAVLAASTAIVASRTPARRSASRLWKRMGRLATIAFARAGPTPGSASSVFSSAEFTSISTGPLGATGACTAAGVFTKNRVQAACVPVP